MFLGSDPYSDKVKMINGVNRTNRWEVNNFSKIISEIYDTSQVFRDNNRDCVSLVTLNHSRRLTLINRSLTTHNSGLSSIGSLILFYKANSFVVLIKSVIWSSSSSLAQSIFCIFWYNCFCGKLGHQTVPIQKNVHKLCQKKKQKKNLT